jgi:DNA repair protein RecO (recombination protein O)
VVTIINKQKSLNLYKTNAIVLRTVKYGETSIIVTLFTELFGIQSYLVNGVRTSAKKASGKANLYQPAALLQLVVYHNELKKLQRIKESGWDYLYDRVFFNVTRHSVALFIVELLLKCLKQPESNPELFQFVNDLLLHLDQCEEKEMANYPLFFALHLATFLGFRIHDNFSDSHHILDLQEGMFVSARPAHPYFLELPFSHNTSELLKIMQPHELQQIKLNRDARRILLNAYQNYYALRIEEFGTLKSIPVLQTVLSA